ncbi:MAG: cytochrome c [Anaerolineae bacterium]|nr:cytochrome c [Anaerolineae bacterium]
MASACGGLAGEPEVVATLPPLTATPQEAGFPQQPPDLANGARIYAENCTRCHGLSGAGDGELTLTGEVQNPGVFTEPAAARPQTPKTWFDTITNGRLEKLMPPWKDALSEQERWDVAYYTYTLHYQPEQIEAGREVWQAAALSLELTDQRAMSALSDQALHDQIVAAVGSDYSDEDIWAAVAYARVQALQNVSVIGETPVAPSTTTEEASESLPVGVVTGQITNGTALGTVPPDLPVTLFASDGQQITQRLETTADADGNFRFDGVAIDPDQSYIALTAYLDRTFVSDFVRGEGDSLQLPITLYELTEDPSVITITGVVSQITAVGEGLQVVQVFNFSNNSDRMFTTNEPIGEDQFASLVIPLPPGAIVIGFPENEQRYTVVEDESTVIDSAPVLPGSDHLVQIVWFLAYEDGAIIEQGINYALEAPVRLLLRPDTVTASSDQFESLGPQTVGDATYIGYGGELSLQAGDSILYELSGTGVTTAAEVETPVSTPNNLLVIVIVVVIAQALVIGGLFFFYRRRRSQPEPQDKNRVIDALVQQIAELDAKDERGEINHDLYHHQRRQLKARLTELMDEETQS